MKDDPKDFEVPKGRPQTVKNVGPDGKTHIYGWNEKTKAYDLDLGPVEKEPHGPIEPEEPDEEQPV